MKRQILIFLLCVSFLQAKESVHVNLFLGHDIIGQTKVDRTEIKEKFSELNFSAKGTISYKIYEMMDITGTVQYESYNLDQGEYSLVPLTVGIRYIDKNFGNFRPYATMSYGTNFVIGIDELPVNTKLNGFGEIDIGTFYKDKYIFEITYKHHALAHVPTWPSLSSFWNGQTIGLNIGYKVK